MEPRRSKRARVEKDFGHDYYVFNIEENLQNLKEALTSPNSIFQKEAVNDEMESLISNRTWCQDICNSLVRNICQYFM